MQLNNCRLEEHESDRKKVVDENDALKAKLEALLEQYQAKDKYVKQQVQLWDLMPSIAASTLQAWLFSKFCQH